MTVEPKSRGEQRRVGRGGRVAVVVALLSIGAVSIGLVVAGEHSGATANQAVGCAQPTRTGAVVLPSRPAGSEFRPQAGEPPANVLAALPVPVGARAYRTTAQGVGGYDATVSYTSTYTFTQLSAFYPMALQTRGWTSVCVLQHRTLAQKAGDDGFYWETGVTVHEPALAGSTSPASFDIRLYQVNDN